MNEDTYDPVEIALREDLGPGDVTTDSFVTPAAQAAGRIVVREKAVIAGTGTARDVFHRLDPSLNIYIVHEDGTEVNAGESVIEVRGSARSILKGERVALNFLQHLCGIATLTRQYVVAAENERVKILDTRKTTPGLRALEKAAVRAGGGENHRFGLYDMVLLKDNHLTLEDGFSELADRIQQTRRERPELRIEVEADHLRQVRAFVKIPEIDLILLDNMTPAQLREAVALRRGQIKFEASGAVNLRNIRRIAATGVDYISIGALTHSARAIDLSLELNRVTAS